MNSPFATLGSVVLILSGLYYISLAGTYTAPGAVTVSDQPVLRTVEQHAASQKTVPASLPQRIISSDIGVDVAVAKGSHDPSTNSWSLNQNDAFIAAGTASPLIYGHNTVEVFSGLSRARVGTKFTVSYENFSKTYEYVATRFVDQGENSVLYEQNPDGVIVLMTCSGAFDELRRLVYIKEVL